VLVNTSHLVFASVSLRFLLDLAGRGELAAGCDLDDPVGDAARDAAGQFSGDVRRSRVAVGVEFGGVDPRRLRVACLERGEEPAALGLRELPVGAR